MAEIIAIDESIVKIGTDNGQVVSVPIAKIAFANPSVGDQVNLYKEGDDYMVRKASGDISSATSGNDRRRVSKIAYILLCFFLGGLGVHRFMRGQVGIGICMILFGWMTFGIWWLIDFIISLSKLSAYQGDDFIFTPDGRWAS